VRWKAKEVDLVLHQPTNVPQLVLPKEKVEETVKARVLMKVQMGIDTRQMAS
jgi:hypothetical protein